MNRRLAPDLLQLQRDVVTVEDKLNSINVALKKYAADADALMGEVEDLEGEVDNLEENGARITATEDEWKRALYLLHQVDDMHGEGRRMSGWLVACLMKDIHEFVREKP